MRHRAVGFPLFAVEPNETARHYRHCVLLMGIGDFLLFADSFPPLFLNILMLTRVVVIVNDDVVG